MSKIIVVALSAGGLDPLLQIMSGVPTGCGASIFIVQHIGSRSSILPELLALKCWLPADFACDGELIESGHTYIAPPDHHMRLGIAAISLDKGPKVHFARTAADPLFISAAEIYGENVIGIVLSGGDSDGADGLRAIKTHGGRALVQDPREAMNSDMPMAALISDHPDMHLSASDLAEYVASVCAGDKLEPVKNLRQKRNG